MNEQSFIKLSDLPVLSQGKNTNGDWWEDCLSKQPGPINAQLSLLDFRDFGRWEEGSVYSLKPRRLDNSADLSTTNFDISESILSRVNLDAGPEREIAPTILPV